MARLPALHLVPISIVRDALRLQMTVLENCWIAAQQKQRTRFDVISRRSSSTCCRFMYAHMCASL